MLVLIALLFSSCFSSQSPVRVLVSRTLSIPFLQARDEILIDYRRGRVLKKLHNLVKGPTLMEPLTRLSQRSWFNIMAILAVHIIFFGIFVSLVQTRSK